MGYHNPFHANSILLLNAELHISIRKHSPNRLHEDNPNHDSDDRVFAPVHGFTGIFNLQNTVSLNRLDRYDHGARLNLPYEPKRLKSCFTITN